MSNPSWIVKLAGAIASCLVAVHVIAASLSPAKQIDDGYFLGDAREGGIEKEAQIAMAIGTAEKSHPIHRPVVCGPHASATFRKRQSRDAFACQRFSKRLTLPERG